MKRVLLTGASGFIGRHILPKLLARNYDVHAVSFHSSINPPTNVSSYQCQLLDRTQTSQLIKKVAPTHLLHMAWEASPGKFWNSELNIEWITASLHLMREFIHYGGKRIVMAGSCAEYDWNFGMLSEYDTPLNPSTLYGQSKAFLYQIMNAYTKQINFSSAWGRLFFLYGPYEYKQRLIPSVITQLLSGEFAECTHARQIRDFLFVEDVADAFVALLDSQLQGAINIGSGEAVTLKSIINKLADNLDGQGRIRFGTIIAPENEAPRIVSDVSRLQNELNWKPKYTLDQGLEKTISWWQEQNIHTTIH